VFGALCLGIADYFRKCGFQRAVLGLSGGIDSAVVACLAARALGPQNVIAVAMPSRFSAAMSTEDAASLAQGLGLSYQVMPIENSVVLAHERYRQAFGEYRDELTLENLQARERGKILMEISNDQRALVLSTGNKTEYALGYTTLYGDMCGGLAAIGDVSKPDVYRLARYFNESEGRELIPQRTFSRPPSAELREGQVDPFDYSRISPLTDLIVERRLSTPELLERGFTVEEVSRVRRLVRGSEYKRKQAPPILRVSSKAFGIGRRMPIVNHFEEI
jgi:NAD+ synthetase